MDKRAVGVHVAVIGVGGCVLKRQGLADDVDDVEAEVLDTLGAPEVDGPSGLGTHGRVVPVEVGLGAVVEAQVVQAGVTERRPGGAAELGDPVGGQRAVLLGRQQVEVVLVGGVSSQGPLEPLMIGGDVVENHVQHDADAALTQGGDKVLEVLHGSHGWVDGAVVGDVVAIVPARRGEEGVEPDMIHPQRGDVVDLLNDAAQVAYAVAGGVAEGLGIDLVDDAVRQ